MKKEKALNQQILDAAVCAKGISIPRLIEKLVEIEIDGKQYSSITIRRHIQGLEASGHLLIKRESMVYPAGEGKP